MEKIDLHLHSNESDGELSKRQLIEKCIKVGCKKIAITDHDVISDYSEYSRYYNIPIINGIEFTTSTKGMHILGFDPENIDVIQKYMIDINLENENICLKIIDLLYSDGYDISLEQVLEYIKQIGISFKYINKKHIVKYLIYKEYFKSVFDVYNELMGEEKKYYFPNKVLSKFEVIDLIKDNGGVAILAHPSTLYYSDYEIEQELKLLIDYGLDGIEVRNRSLTLEQGKRYEKIANKLGILCTMGSDFHSPYHDIIGVDAPKDIYNNLVRRMMLSKKR